jgi:hypothetical protein
LDAAAQFWTAYYLIQQQQSSLEGGASYKTVCRAFHHLEAAVLSPIWDRCTPLVGN